MHIHTQSLDSLWETFLTDRTRHSGLDPWTITDIYVSPHHIGHHVAVRLANPFTREVQLISVPPVSRTVLSAFVARYTERFEQQFERRFQCFDPETLSAYAEYDSWEHFERTWLMSDGTPHYDKCIPLLFDHISDGEYRTRTQLDMRRLDYQRLKVTVFVQKTNQFYDFFITHITDDACAAIRQTLQSRMMIHGQSLFLREREAPSQ